MAQNPTPITMFPAGTSVLETDVYVAVDTTDPTQSPSGTTKKYTMEQLAAFVTSDANSNNIDSCVVATTVNLNATYSDGPDADLPGVGATLTNSSSLVALIIDGVTLSVDDRVLVKNQTNQAHNGIYFVQIAGSGSVAWILERATDYDGVNTNQIQEGDFVIVSRGTINLQSLWIQTGQGPFIVGTTDIIFEGLNISTVTGTLPVAQGGTGNTTFTPYSLITAGTSATTPFQNVSGLGTLNQVLVSQGPGTLPIWAAVPGSGAVTSITGTVNQLAANGVFTPQVGAVTLTLVGPYTPSTYTAHGVLLGEDTSSIVATSPGTSGQLLQSGGGSADPNWTTATYPSTTTINTLLYSSSANTVTNLTTDNNAVLVTDGSGVPSLGGTLPNSVQDNITRLGTIASIGAPLGGSFGGTGINNGASTITVGGNTAFSGSFTFTGTITGNTAVTFPTSGTLATTSGSVVTVVTDSGSATPSAGSISLLGTANQVSTSASGSTITLALPQNIATSSSPTFAALTLSAPLPVTSGGTGLATTTINTILYSTSANVIGQIATDNSSVLTTNASGVPSFVGPLTNGQLIIGSTGAQPVAATLTAGAGITITNTAGGITLSTSGFTGAWTDEATNFAAASDNGYFTTSTVTATLPSNPAQGDVVQFVVDTASILTVTANTGQRIRMGVALSSVAGTATNNAIGDSLSLVYRSSDLTWFSLGAPQGTWTLA